MTFARARRAVLLGALALFLYACDASDGAPVASARPPVPVQVVTVAPQRLPRTLSSVGSLESPDMATVASEVRGRIISLDVPEGRRVEEGHILVQLDDAESGAALRRAQARLRNARDRLHRLEKLRDQSVSSEQAYDDAKSEFDAARASFDEEKTRVGKTTILAPFTGVLGMRQVNVGQYVDAGTAVAELTQVDPLELHFGIPQRHAAQIALGQTVHGRVGRCGPRFEGTVDVIDPRVDPATRSLQLQASIPNPDGVLYPGMAVSLQLVVGELDDALVVPQEAIVRQGTKHIVYSLDPEDHAQQHTVELGQFSDAGVRVRSGLEPGARVVAAGQQKLRPGAATRPAPFEPTQNPNLALGRDGDGCPSDGSGGA